MPGLFALLRNPEFTDPIHKIKQVTQSALFILTNERRKQEKKILNEKKKLRKNSVSDPMNAELL